MKHKKRDQETCSNNSNCSQCPLCEGDSDRTGEICSNCSELYPDCRKCSSCGRTYANSIPYFTLSSKRCDTCVRRLSLKRETKSKLQQETASEQSPAKKRRRKSVQSSDKKMSYLELKYQGICIGKIPLE